MKILQKITWTEPTHKNRKFVVNSVLGALFCLSLFGMVVSGATEFNAIYSTSKSLFVAIPYMLIIELGYNTMFYVSALLLVLYLSDKKTKSFLLFSVITFLLGCAVFFVSRNISNEGKDLGIDKYYTSPSLLQADSTTYNQKSIYAEQWKAAKVDSINSFYATQLSKDLQPIDKSKKRDKWISFTFGLDNIDVKISEHKGFTVGTWQNNTFKSLKKHKKSLKNKKANIVSNNKSLKADAILSINSEYNKLLADATNTLITETTKTNNANTGLTEEHETKKSNLKSYGSFAIVTFLVLQMLFFFTMYLGMFWSGQRPQFEDVKKGSFRHVLANYWLMTKAWFYNRLPKKGVNVEFDEGANEYKFIDKKTGQNRTKQNDVFIANNKDETPTPPNGGKKKDNTIVVSMQHKTPETSIKRTSLQKNEEKANETNNLFANIEEIENDLPTDRRNTILDAAFKKYPMFSTSHIILVYADLINANHLGQLVKNNYNKAATQKKISKPNEKEDYYTRLLKTDMGSAVLIERGYNVFKVGERCNVKRRKVGIEVHNDFKFKTA